MAEFVRRKIEQQKSIGDILREARKKKDLTIDQVEEETKVRSKYLLALEEGRYEALPNNVYALGFLAKYADLLELDKNKLIDRFKIERLDNPYFEKIAPERKIKEPIFSFTPKIFAVTGIILALIFILGYIIYSVRTLTAPPNLTISSPSSQQIIKESKVDIIGKTDPGSMVLINNQTVGIDEKGNFAQTVKLNPGLNTFQVKSVSQTKKRNSQADKNTGTILS